MLKLLSWNIQYGKGVDGLIDLKRIRDGILETADADIICLQEISRNEPQTSDGADQLQVLQDYFRDYEAFFGQAYDRSGGVDGKRRQFGNLVLSRIPVKQVVHHPLPSPPDPEKRFMLRQASELQITDRDFSFRLINTHLEYFSEKQQLQQVQQLRGLHQAACEIHHQPGIDHPGTPFEQYKPSQEVIMCGDFNFTPESNSYRQMLEPLPDNTPDLLDAWKVIQSHHQCIGSSACPFDYLLEMKRLFQAVIFIYFLSGCDPSSHHLFYPRTEHQYVVSCAHPHLCFRKADLICGRTYHLRAMQPLANPPHLLIECR